MFKRLLSFRSFRAQTAGIYGGIVVALSLSLSTVFGSMLYSQAREDKGLALEVMTQNAARALGSSMHERNLALLAMTTSSVWAEGLDSKAARETLHRFQAAGTNRTWIGVADTNGVIRNSTGDMLRGKSVAERPWFREGLTHNHVGDVHDAKLLASLLPPSATGEPTRFVDFSAPLMANGKVIGVLGMKGNWEWARKVVQATRPTSSADSGVELYIFDRGGNVILAPERDAEGASQTYMPVRKAGVAPDVKWEDGESYLTAAATLEATGNVSDLGWTVVARQPMQLAFATARATTWFALFLGGTAALLGAYFAWMASGRLSRPLCEISQAARDVEEGVPGAGIPLHRSSEEMERLSTAVDSMTRRLLENKAELEARVLQRTAELETAMGGLEKANVELAKLARHDPLTGLLNRRAFDERMEQALASAKRSGSMLSLLTIDADHFKSVNDRFGHEAGDDVLRTLAALLQAGLRETDTVARLGGEEFAVLLPDTDTAGAMEVANKLVARAAATATMGVGVVTLSVGVASSRYTSEARSHLMRVSDKALYEAKAGGRNRAFRFPTLALATAA